MFCCLTIGVSSLSVITFSSKSILAYDWAAFSFNGNFSVFSAGTPILSGSSITCICSISSSNSVAPSVGASMQLLITGSLVNTSSDGLKLSPEFSGTALSSGKKLIGALLIQQTLPKVQ